LRKKKKTGAKEEEKLEREEGDEPLFEAKAFTRILIATWISKA